ncbi:MAG: SpoIID/LytB domain-containing protein [Gemmatimonadaceae bacterium]
MTMLFACSATAGPVKPVPAPAPAPTPASATRPSVPAAAPAFPATARPAPRAGTIRPGTRGVGDRSVRVALGFPRAETRVDATGGWRLDSGFEGRDFLARGHPGEPWVIERSGLRVRGVRRDGAVTNWFAEPIVARAGGDGFLVWNGKRWRGELVFSAIDSGLVVVNRLSLDDYLAGVVPLEIGTSRTWAELAAVQAQAVAARSFAVTRIGSGARWDLRAAVVDQVYGGVDAETPVGTRAVESTTGLVLTYNGRVIYAPYSSTCGGTTAGADEVWRAEGEPWLRSVSDRIPGTDRHYCDISSRFRWTRTLLAPEVDALVSRYLRQYAKVPASGPGTVRDVVVDQRTASGRVGTLALLTATGTYRLRGNEIRNVLRASGGEILPSTYFTVETTTGTSGALDRLVIHGRGNGHGVGMCQFGAIGRARAGQDFREILQAYYPGTSITTAD